MTEVLCQHSSSATEMLLPPARPLTGPQILVSKSKLNWKSNTLDCYLFSYSVSRI